MNLITKQRILLLVGWLLSVFTPVTAFSYIGPGAGLSAIGSILAFIGVITLLLVGFLWYPIKRLRNQAKNEEDGSAAVYSGIESLDETSDESSSLP